MSFINTILNGLTTAQSWLSDTEDVLSGVSRERKLLLNRVTPSIKNQDGSPIIWDAGRFINQNEILKRFHMGNEFGSLSSNPVFTPGFEDPTRLMFKIEFGEWGSSLIDIETIRTQQVTSKFSNVYFEDYDLFPMGLLNLDFLDFDGNTSWNDQKSYNTYNYLMNRNEDARANYIKLFVQGLYIIQKDMPYIFQKISGLDKLQELNLGKGRRIKDAKITIDCIEGIDMKIRTLLQLYRKAAYDDVWQRWILPDIYRYFKMIIYVFDRRILQTGVGTYSIDLDNFPIYAFECGPCEIDIESTFENEFSANYADHKDSETKINITVHNVKTYYSNQLFNKVENNNAIVNWISDFDTIKEQGDIQSTDVKNNFNFRQRWMTRMFMMPSEYRAYYNNVTHKFGTWSEDVDDKNISDEEFLYIHDSGGVIWPDNTWHKAVVQDESIYDIRSWSGLLKYLKKSLNSHTTMIRDSRFADRDYMVNDLTRPYEHSYIYEPHFMYMGPNVKHAEHLMRIRIELMIQHMLNSTYFYDNSYYYSIVDPGLLYDTSLPNMKLEVGPTISEKIPDLVLIKPDFNLDKAELIYVRPEYDEHKNEMTYVTTLVDEHKNSSISFVENIENLDKAELDYIEPEYDEHKNEMTYVTTLVDEHKNTMNYIKPTFDEHKNDMEFISPIFEEHKNRMSFIYPTTDLHKSSMNYIKPTFDEHKNDMEFISPTFDEHKNEMNYVTTLVDEHKNDMELIEPDMTSEPQKPLKMVKPIMDKHKNSMEFVEPDMTVEKAEDQTLVKPVSDEHKNNMEFVENVINDENQLTQTMLSLNTKPEEIKQKPMVTVNVDDTVTHGNMLNTAEYQDTHKEPMLLLKDFLDTHKSSQALVELLQDTHKPSYSLSESIYDTHKPTLELVENELDIHKPKQNLINDIQIDHKPTLNLVPGTIETNTLTQNLIPLSPFDDQPQQHNQMVIPEYNEFKSTTLLTPVLVDNSKSILPMNSLNINEAVNNMDMTSLVGNEALQEMDMTSLVGNEALQEMDMTHLSTNTSLPSMDMTHLSSNTSLPDMDMTHLSINVSLPGMDMTLLLLNTSLPDMVMTLLLLNSSLPGMDMTLLLPVDDATPMVLQQPIINIELSDMIMVEPIILNNDINMTMTEPISYDVVNSSVMTSLYMPTYDVSMSMATPSPVRDIPVTPMVQPVINTDNVHALLIPVDVNDNKVHTPLIPLQKDTDKPNTLMNGLNILDEHTKFKNLTNPIIDTSTSTMDMLTTILDSSVQPKMKMIELSDSPKLILKIQALTKIDLNELKTTNLLDLLSLADIIEQTYDEIKDRAKHMKLQDNLPNIPKHVHMKMQHIELPERNQFIVNKINGVDLTAIDRAWQAKRNVETEHTDGGRGTAI